MSCFDAVFLSHHSLQVLRSQSKERGEKYDSVMARDVCIHCFVHGRECVI